MYPLLIYVCGVIFSLLWGKLPNRPILKGICHVVLVICLVGGGWLTWHQDSESKQEKKQDEKKWEERDANAERRNSGLLAALVTSTNVLPPTKCQLLSDQMSEVQKQIDVVRTEKTLWTSSPISLKNMRESYKRDVELFRLTNEMNRLIVTSNSIIQAEKLRVSQEAEVTRAKAEQQEKINSAKEWHRKAMAVYDIAIATLHSQLSELSGQTGLQVWSDFKSKPTNMRNSAMVKNDMIIPETNRIAIGTNQAWCFEIQTVESSFDPVSGQINERDFPLVLKITTKETGSNAVITARQFNARPIMSRSDHPTDGVTVSAFSPNGIGVTHAERLNGEYSATIAQWVLEILRAQDAQYPLIPTNAPSK